MANGNPRLEVEIGAVTEDLKRGLSEARNELRKFSKVTGLSGVDILKKQYNDARIEALKLSATMKDSLAESLNNAKRNTESAKQATEIHKQSLLGARVESLKLSSAIKDSLAESLNNSKRHTESARQVTESYKQSLLDAKRSVEQNKSAITDSVVAINHQKQATEAERTALARTRAELANITLEKRKNQQATTAAAGSYREAQQRLTALGRSIREAQGGFSNTNPLIRQQITEYKNLNNELKRFDSQMGNHQRNVGNYGSALNAIGYVSPQLTSLLGQGGLLIGSALAARDAYKNVARFDSELKNVQKTTGLTSREIEELSRKFVSLSRDLQVVSASELAQYATVAGQLGIKGTENILNFSEALAKLETASNNDCL